MPEINRYLALCTSHLTQEVMDGVVKSVEPNGDHLGASSPYPIIGAPWEYGAWVWAGIEDNLDELPEPLLACINYAKQHDCTYIQFDADVDPISDLPTYEW